VLEQILVLIRDHIRSSVHQIVISLFSYIGTGPTVAIVINVVGGCYRCWICSMPRCTGALPI